MPDQITPEIEALLRDAAEWRLLGLLFECPSDAWQSQLAALAAEVHDPDLRAAAAEAKPEAEEGMYHSIFGPGGPAPPRQATYHESMELGYLMSSLHTSYHAFGYAPATPEPVDHVAVEIGFVAWLKFKEAFARSFGDLEKAELARDAAARFIADYLSTMAEPLANILSHSGIEYLVLAGKVLRQRSGPKKQPLKAHASHFPIFGDAEASFECGTL